MLVAVGRFGSTTSHVVFTAVITPFCLLPARLADCPLYAAAAFGFHLQQYISRLQQLLQVIRCDSSSSLSNPAAAALASSPTCTPATPAAAAQQQACKLVLHRREMTDRHALFSHYYWAVWCLNSSEVATACLQPPPSEHWRAVMQQLQLCRQQLRDVVDARRGLLQELQRVAAEWQKVLPTLALQLLQVGILVLVDWLHWWLCVIGVVHVQAVRCGAGFEGRHNCAAC